MTIPAGALINWMPNPSGELSASGYSDLGAALGLSDGDILAITNSIDQSLYGDKSIKCTVQANGVFGDATLPISPFVTSSVVAKSYLVAIGLIAGGETTPTYSAGDTWSYSIRLMAPGVFVGRSATISALGATDTMALPITLDGSWQELKVTSPPSVDASDSEGRIQFFLLVEWDGVDGSTDIDQSFYVDGVLITHNQAIPTDVPYVDGDQGNRFHWEGTPHASRSYYIPESTPGYIPPGSVPGTNGTMQVSAELWASDATGFPLRDLTEHIIDGTVDMNVDRAIMMNLSMKVKDPEAIAPYADYLIPYFNISYQDGRPSERHQLGLWPTKLPASGEYTVNMATGTFQCDDMVSVAINAFSDAVVTQPDTTKITDAVYSRLAQAGVIKRDIPTDSTTFGVAISRPAGTSWGTICNEWLTGLGWYTLHMRLDGYVTTSGAYRDLDQIEPSLILTDTDMLAPLVPVPSENQVVNIAVVTTEANVIPPLVGIARNDTQSSPASTVHIGPRYKYETMPSPTTQAKINKRARLIVQDGRRYYRTVTAQIPPMPQLLEPRQVVELQLTGKQADLSGRWYVRTARMGLTPETAPMTLELNQTVTFDGTVI